MSCVPSATTAYIELQLAPCTSWTVTLKRGSVGDEKPSHSGRKSPTKSNDRPSDHRRERRVGELELVAPEVARVALKLLMLREELARLVVAEAEQHAPWTPAACHRRSEHKHRRLHTETVVTLKPLCPCSLPSKIARWSIQLDKDQCRVSW